MSYSIKRNLWIYVSLVLVLWLFVLVLVLIYPIDSSTDNLAQLTNENSRFIETIDARIHVEDYNSNSAQSVVLIHGFGGSTYSWRENISALQEADYRVVVVDLAGFGLSEKGYEIDYSHPSHARRLNEVLEKLGVQVADFVGHSAGANILLHFSNLYPEKVDDIILVSGSLVFDRQLVPGFLLENPLLVRAVRLGMRGYLSESRFSSVLKSAYADDFNYNSEVKKQYYDRFTHGNWDLGLLGSTRDVGKNALNFEIDELNNDIYYIWGSEDSWVDAAAVDRVKQRVELKGFYEIENAGHLPMEEKSDQVNEILLGIIK